MREPEEEATDPIPWLMDTDDAFVVAQERVLVDPGWIKSGEKEKEEMRGVEVEAAEAKPLNVPIMAT